MEQFAPEEKSQEYFARLVDAEPAPLSEQTTTLGSPTVGIVAKKIGFAMIAIVVMFGVAMISYVIFSWVWLFLLIAGAGVLGGVLMIFGAFKGKVAPCPFCGALLGASASGDALTLSAEVAAVRCERCGEYCAVQNGQVTAHALVSREPPAFEAPLYKNAVWPRGCVACGAEPVRFSSLTMAGVNLSALLVGALSTYSGSTQGVPYCGEHKGAVTLKKTDDDKLLVCWSSLPMMRRYVASNRASQSAPPR